MPAVHFGIVLKLKQPINSTMPQLARVDRPVGELQTVPSGTKLSGIDTSNGLPAP